LKPTGGPCRTNPIFGRAGLRGMVNIDPYKDDLFKRVIEQRKLHKSSPELYYWLKIFANSIYGFFVEIELVNEV
jgi:hypothetical protein